MAMHGGARERHCFSFHCNVLAPILLVTLHWFVLRTISDHVRDRKEDLLIRIPVRHYEDLLLAGTL
ncbi:unnamed protein product [Amoebophrya sp. A120]|nr:unnamed protein product [Amoebophrya sp. A120]|eukprot:GSA120T00006242001.1